MVNDSFLSCYLVDQSMVTCGLEIERKYGTEKNWDEGEEKGETWDEGEEKGETFELYLKKNESSGWLKSAQSFWGLSKFSN